MKRKPFVVYDWAGNICFKGREFDSFESAWAFIRESYASLVGEEFDEQMSEYHVERIK